MSQGGRYFNSLNEEPGAIRVHARGQQMSSSSRETRSAEFHHRVGMTLERRVRELLVYVVNHLYNGL